jgi:hypothetical protein
MPRFLTVTAINAENNNSHTTTRTQEQIDNTTFKEEQNMKTIYFLRKLLPEI